MRTSPLSCYSSTAAVDPCPIFATGQLTANERRVAYAQMPGSRLLKIVFQMAIGRLWTSELSSQCIWQTLHVFVLGLARFYTALTVLEHSGTFDLSEVVESWAV